MRVAIVAAMQREIAPLVNGWQSDLALAKKNIHVYWNDVAVVACAGMGAERATLAVQAAMAHGPVSALISTGFAGACDPKLRVGEMVRAGVVIDAKTGERQDDSQYRQVLVTVDRPASVAEKARLYGSYYASAVDMEAATVMRLAQMNGVRFFAVKVISDEAGFEIAGMDRYVTRDGQFREIAFAVNAILNPMMWGKLIQLKKNSDRAVKNLCIELQSQMRWFQEGM